MSRLDQGQTLTQSVQTKNLKTVRAAGSCVLQGINDLSQVFFEVQVRGVAKWTDTTSAAVLAGVKLFPITDSGPQTAAIAYLAADATARATDAIKDTLMTDDNVATWDVGVSFIGKTLTVTISLPDVNTSQLGARPPVDENTVGAVLIEHVNIAADLAGTPGKGNIVNPN